MKNKLTKAEIEQKIKELFSKNPNKIEIKKIKKLTMSKNIKLTNYKKRFCKFCYSVFDSHNSEIRIKKGFKIIKCKNCSYITRNKIK